MGRRLYFVPIIALSAVVGAFAVGGCGNEKPEYCSKTDDLQQSVDTLKGDVTSANFSKLQPDLALVEGQATVLVNSAKQDFPSETSAVDSSVSTLSASINGLSASPKPQQVLQVGSQVSAVVSAVKDFVNATKSEC